MNTVSEPTVWQPLKRTMVENLNKKKVPHTLQILAEKYSDSTIITLQEVSSSFIDQAVAGPLGKKFHIVASANMDPVRDQNSVILLCKTNFPKGMEREISDQVSAAFPDGVRVPVALGDILAITTKDQHGVPFVVASFHGDTNGLATKPVLDAVLAAMKKDPVLANHHLIFGMDGAYTLLYLTRLFFALVSSHTLVRLSSRFAANTYENAIVGKQQDVMEWGRHYVQHGLTSCWGDVPDPKNYTTYNARTFLQPQLNKACRQDEKRSKGDVNPKDFILFRKSSFGVVRTWKDNTGEKKYIEDMAFPTLTFPSDHGILATILEPTFPADETK
jgi:hypothetical protein